MKCKLLGSSLLLALFFFLCPSIPAQADCQDGIQSSGALYRICMPADGSWNGDLVLFAHGYVSPFEDLAIPESQLSLPDGTYLPDLITQLGYAFAITSFRANGLVVPEAIDDLVELATEVFPSEQSAPERILLAGASEGGLVTALAIERHPDVFDGGLATCGPVGNFSKQIDYFGDFRVVFDYFFPGVIPGSPVDIPTEVIENWGDYVPAIEQALASRPHATEQLLRVTRAPVDPTDLTSIGETVLGILWYNVFATNDARQRLDGQPFDNSKRIYLGSDNDFLLNWRVQRFRADPAALQAIEDDFQTSGQLIEPLVTLHTTGDPIVPYWHERLYSIKTLFQGSALWHANRAVERYGHCAFTGQEASDAFALLVRRVLIAEWLR